MPNRLIPIEEGHAALIATWEKVGKPIMDGQPPCMWCGTQHTTDTCPVFEKGEWIWPPSPQPSHKPARTERRTS